MAKTHYYISHDSESVASNLRDSGHTADATDYAVKTTATPAEVSKACEPTASASRAIYTSN